MSTPGNSTLKQALDMGDGDRPEDRLHKLVGYLDHCTACSPKVKAEFLKRAAADWNVMALLAGGKGSSRR